MYINRNTAVNILNLLAKSYIRDTVGVYNVDDVITTGRSEIQAKVKEKLSERLEAEDIGIGIVNVTIQDAEPPTENVQAAFKAVEDAKQGMDTKINQAKQYQSEQSRQQCRRGQSYRSGGLQNAADPRAQDRLPVSGICMRNISAIP